MHRYLKNIFIMIICELVFLGIGLSSLDTHNAQAASNTNLKEETGYSNIFENNKEIARSNAINDACYKLILNSIGKDSPEQRKAEFEFYSISHYFDSSLGGMVKNQKVIKEGMEDDLYFVKLEGEVNPEAIKDMMNATYKKYATPKVMILLKETNDEGKTANPGMTFTEAIIGDILNRDQFPYFTFEEVRVLMAKRPALMKKALERKLNGDEALKSFLLDEAGAEILICGEIEIKKYGECCYTISIKLAAMDVYTGNILATHSSSTGVNSGKKRTFNDALIKINHWLYSDQIFGFLDGDGHQSGHFIQKIQEEYLRFGKPAVLTITGLGSQEITRFKNFLACCFQGVDKVKIKSQSEKETNFDILLYGKTADFAEELVSRGATAGYDIKVAKVSLNKIQITAKK